jgi:hypothetical protein
LLKLPTLMSTLDTIAERCGPTVSDRDDLLTAMQTALHHAAFRGFSEIVEYLLKCGADPNAKTTEGLTPLHAAAMAGRMLCISLVLPRRRCRRCRFELYRLAVTRSQLVEYGANIWERDASGEDVLSKVLLQSSIRVLCSVEVGETVRKVQSYCPSSVSPILPPQCWFLHSDVRFFFFFVLFGRLHCSCSNAYSFLSHSFYDDFPEHRLHRLSRSPTRGDTFLVLPKDGGPETRMKLLLTGTQLFLC